MKSRSLADGFLDDYVTAYDELDVLVLPSCPESMVAS